MMRICAPAISCTLQPNARMLHVEAMRNATASCTPNHLSHAEIA